MCLYRDILDGGYLKLNPPETSPIVLREIYYYTSDWTLASLLRDFGKQPSPVPPAMANLLKHTNDGIYHPCYCLPSSAARFVSFHPPVQSGLGLQARSLEEW